MISKFIRDLVVEGKSFSMEIIVEDSSEGASAVEELIKCSKFAHKYTDRMSLRTQEEYIRAEYQSMKDSYFKRDKDSSSSLFRNHKRLIVNEYQKIPEEGREEIERMLVRSRGRESFRVMDSSKLLASDSISYIDTPRSPNYSYAKSNFFPSKVSKVSQRNSENFVSDFPEMQLTERNDSGNGINRTEF
jgi:hypothetical protein